MENFLKFDAIDAKQALVLIGYLIGWILLAVLLVFAVYIIRERLGRLAQLGLLLLFLGFNTLLPFYLAVPAFLLLLVVVGFFSHYMAIIRKPRE
jgi:hypothetical protein